MSKQTPDMVPITAFFNGWEGTDVGYSIHSAGAERETQLFGRLTPGEDSWGKPAFLLPPDARPRELKKFADILMVTEDGRVIPQVAYSRYNTYRGVFHLDPYVFYLPPLPIPTAPLNPPPTDEQIVRQYLLTPSERALAWSLFWPEWVVRKAAGVLQSAWGYVVALHILWSQSVHAESRQTDGE